MSVRRIGAGILAGLALAAAPRVEAQVAVGGGLGVYWVAPAIAPLYPYPYYGGVRFPDPARFIDDLPSCYRFGRCSLRDVERFLDRPNRLERLAPAAPAGAPRADWERAPRAAVAPTPAENIRPEYRSASLPRPEFSDSGRPR